jgi:hypothetical protein
MLILVKSGGPYVGLVLRGGGIGVALMGFARCGTRKRKPPASDRDLCEPTRRSTMVRYSGDGPLFAPGLRGLS